MKKVSVKTIVIALLAYIVLGALVGGIVGGIVLKENTVMIVVIAVVAAALFGYADFIFGIRKGMAKKTIQKNKDSKGFANCDTFTSANESELLMINRETGKIAYVSAMNPNEFQIIDGTAVSDVKSDMIKGPLGGTGYVYFQCKINGKKFRMSTLYSRQMYSLKSIEVMEAVSKADTYAQLLTECKAAAEARKTA